MLSVRAFQTPNKTCSKSHLPLVRAWALHSFDGVLVPGALRDFDTLIWLRQKRGGAAGRVHQRLDARLFERSSDDVSGSLDLLGCQFQSFH